MSDIGPSGGGQNPFQNIFGDLARLLGANAGKLNWDVARQVASLIAGEGQSEGNPDPIERIRFEDLSRIAQMHVDQVTGLNPIIRSVEAVSHVDWAMRTLEDYQVLLDTLADALSQEDDDGADTAALANPTGMPDMQQFLQPVLLGIQVGGMVGSLAQKTCGQFDLPIPRGVTEILTIVPANLHEFADDWSLPEEELLLYFAVEEITRVAIFQQRHVSQRFTELIKEYVGGFRPNLTTLEDQLGGLDFNDPSQLPAALNDPDALLGALQTPEQQQVLNQLSTLTAVFVGYVDYVVNQVAAKLIPSGGAIHEANMRRRVEESDGARLMERMLGMELNQAQFDKGTAFIEGIIERERESDLSLLWRSIDTLPTPAELGAPGLWLARIDL